jgi:integrase
VEEIMPRRAKGLRLYLRERDGRPAVYVIVDGDKEHSTGCGPTDLRQAEQRLADYAAEKFQPNRSERSLAKIKVSDVLALYARDVAPTKPSAQTIGYHCKALMPFWQDKTLNDVRGSTCRAYLNGRTGLGVAKSSTKLRQVSSSTVRRELKTLQAAINYWHKESPIEAIPKVSLPDEGERRERVLSRKEVAQLLWACRKRKADHVARFILIGIYTGTRHQAILKLRWSAALVGGHIDIERGVIYRRGSAEKDTSKRRPIVSIPKRLGTFVARWRQADGPAALVIRHDGAGILKMKRAWKGAVKAAGLGSDVTPHVLRHTCASWLLWEGKTIWDVAGIIGADATTVQKVYGHHRLAVESRAKAGHNRG